MIVAIPEGIGRFDAGKRPGNAPKPRRPQFLDFPNPRGPNPRGPKPRRPQFLHFPNPRGPNPRGPNPRGPNPRGREPGVHTRVPQPRPPPWRGGGFPP
jgi:hypothetical protein